ncbi:hypothetical protein F5B20DRAFT_564413 [Whalleya microplaca]|nr:hypothetical protein F5B20DRAFT_564413 [Whalleya microplaca]
MTITKEAIPKSSPVGNESYRHESPQESVPSPRLEGQELPGNTPIRRFEIDKLLRKENHSDVYTVIDSNNACLVAHIYDLNDISPKVRQYRLRNLKKCSRRAVTEIKFQGKIVLFCQQDSSFESRQENLPDRTLLMQTETTRADVPDTKVKRRRRTVLQKEAARIKQQEKRRDQRRRKQQLKVQRDLCEKGVSARAEPHMPDMMASEPNFIMLYLLHVAYNDKRPELRSLLPPATRDVLQHYLQPKRELIFQDVEQMGMYLRFKHNEALTLRLLFEKRLPIMLDKASTGYRALLQKQAVFKKGSTEWDQMDQSVKIAHNQLMVVMRAKGYLPNLISSAKKECRQLEKRHNQAKKANNEMDRLETLVVERSKLESKVAALGS